jgi:hypothetical protein
MYRVPAYFGYWCKLLMIVDMYVGVITCAGNPCIHVTADLNAQLRL